MITPELKDTILKTLTDAGVKLNFNLNQLAKELNIDRDVLEIILNQFENQQLMSIERMLGGGMYVTLSADAFDFIRMGGFTMREKTLILTLEKLQLEVEKLSSDYPEKASTFTSIAANIATCLTFLATMK
ncbi:MAG: hypothetical protein H3C36_03030 [Chitinophagaceae bacterium]|nr:hypothetical protein [Chitinophagaceae bacterium]